MCDLILFMTKMSPIPGLENKKVSVDVSYLDTSSNTLIVSTTDAGIIESILGKYIFKFPLFSRNIFFRHGAVHRGRAAGGGLAGGPDWPRVHREDQGQP